MYAMYLFAQGCLTFILLYTLGLPLLTDRVFDRIAILGQVAEP